MFGRPGLCLQGKRLLLNEAGVDIGSHPPDCIIAGGSQGGCLPRRPYMSLFLAHRSLLGSCVPFYMEAFMALLELLNVEGNDAEDSGSVTETWYCEYSDVASGYSLAYPAVGVPWNENSAYVCSSIQYSRENMKYYSATNSTHNGADVVLLKATYTINYETYEDE